MTGLPTAAAAESSLTLTPSDRPGRNGEVGGHARDGSSLHLQRLDRAHPHLRERLPGYGVLDDYVAAGDRADDDPERQSLRSGDVVVTPALGTRAAGVRDLRARCRPGNQTVRFQRRERGRPGFVG